MLIEVTITAIKGESIPGTTLSAVVNSDNMYWWKDLTSGSSFFYVMNPNDRREKAKHITISESVATLLAAANTAYGDNLVKLPVETTVGGTTTDMYIPVKSITWCEKASNEADHSLVRFCEGGFRTREVMVPFSLNDMTYVASTGTSSS